VEILLLKLFLIMLVILVYKNLLGMERDLILKKQVKKIIYGRMVIG
jgi:hypothetical protein